METKHYVVRFKEANMPRPVKRDCWLSSEEEAIKLYGLNEDDIEWYEIEEIK